MKKIVVFLGLILAGFSLCGQVDTIPDSKLQPFYGTRHIVNMSGTDTMAFYQPGDTAHIMANDSIYIHQLLNHDITAGHYGDSVNYTWIASDTIAVESAEVRLYANDNFKGALKRVTVPADTFYIDTDNVRYIGAFWNSGNPEMRKVQDRTGLNMSDGVPLLTIYKQNGNKYVSDWTVGNGLMERMFKKDIFLDRYERQSGLILDTLNNMNVQVSSGTLWQGGRDFDLEYVSSVADSMYWYWYDGTNWQYKDTTDIIVDYYNDETGLQTLNNNRYVSVWFFRAVCCEPALFMVVDDEQYNKYDDAVTNRLLPSNLPNAVTKFSIFLGRVVVEEDATAVDLIELSDEFTDVPGAGISSSGITDHGDMVGLEDDDHPQYLNLNGRGGQTISDEISLDTNNITNLADPVNDQDAATKNYVDASSSVWNTNGNYIYTYDTVGINTSFSVFDPKANLEVNGDIDADNYKGNWHTKDTSYFVDIENDQLIEGKKTFAQYPEIAGDWFMPSLQELDRVYDEIHSPGINSYGYTEAYYTSTELDSVYVRGVYFGDGSWGSVRKNQKRDFIPVREFTSSEGYSVGDVGPAGGYIFYKDGNYYMEARSQRYEPNVVWSNVDSTLVGTGELIGTGSDNTEAIINQEGHEISAALKTYRLSGGNPVPVNDNDLVNKKYVDQTLSDSISGAAGTNGQLQYNDNGSLAGADITYEPNYRLSFNNYDIDDSGLDLSFGLNFTGNIFSMYQGAGDGTFAVGGVTASNYPSDYVFAGQYNNDSVYISFNGYQDGSHYSIDSDFRIGLRSGSGADVNRDAVIHYRDTMPLNVEQNGSKYLQFYQDTMDVYKYARFNGGSNVGGGAQTQTVPADASWHKVAELGEYQAIKIVMHMTNYEWAGGRWYGRWHVYTYAHQEPYGDGTVSCDINQQLNVNSVLEIRCNNSTTSGVDLEVRTSVDESANTQIAVSIIEML
jgi:hypothetical protein